MFWLILGLLFFRWPLLSRFIGVKLMHLFDAVMFTIIAAINFAQPGESALFSYVIGATCIFWGWRAGRRYLMFDELMKAEQDGKEEGKSDDGTASGS